MYEKRTSPSDQSIFIIPVDDKVELYLEYNGTQWSNDSINEEKLRIFSEGCLGIHIAFLEAGNGKFLLFSPKNDMEDSIKIYFEKIYPDQLPGAFFDKISKTYDNFELPSQTMQMTVCFGAEGGIELEWKYEEEEISDPPVENPTDGTRPTLPPIDIPTGTGTSGTDTEEILEKENAELKKTNEELSFKISEYEEEEKRLSRKIAELQNENERLKSFSGNSSEDKEKEIDHLKTLITQLVDSQFDEGYIKTQDARINEMTASISEHRKARAEKEASLRSLEQEESEVKKSIADIKQEIINTMDSIHKAEGIKQEQSVELSDVQASLQEILSEIDMDMDTLEMYSEQDSMSSVISEARDAKSIIEEKLKSFVLERQKDCDERSKRIQSS